MHPKLTSLCSLQLLLVLALPECLLLPKFLARLQTRGCIMARFVTALFRCIIAMALAGGTALMPTSSEAARISKADKVVLKEAIIACKAEARGKKVKWLARRKYVNHCVAEALKDRPNIDVIQLLKNHPGLIDLPAEQWDAI